MARRQDARPVGDLLVSTIATVRSALAFVQEKDVTFLAASVAFYAFFSVIPALLLVLVVGSVVGGEAFAERIVSLVGDFLSDSGQAVVEEALAEPSGAVGAGTVGTIALLWSAFKVFRALDIAFDRIYPVDADTSILEQIRNALVVMICILLALALIVGVSAALRLPAIAEIPFVNVAGYVLLLAALTLALLPLYYVMPPVSVSLREILPGTVTAVGGWILLQILFRVYAANAGQYDAYGFVGAVLLFLFWLYLAAVVLLLGATVNVAIAEGWGGGRGGRTPTDPQSS